MTPPILAITFDAAGTLFEVVESVGDTYSRIARIHGVKADQIALDNAFRTLWNQVAPPHEAVSAETAGSDGHEIERRWWKVFVRRVFSTACQREFLISEENFDRLFKDLFDHYAKASAWRLRRGVMTVLDAIHGRFKLGIISNFDHRFHEIFEGLALKPYFDSVTLSSAVGASKPDSTIFHAAARSLGVMPSEILHVGDDPARDWNGAKAAGFQVYHLDSDTDSFGKISAWIASRQ